MRLTGCLGVLALALLAPDSARAGTPQPFIPASFYPVGSLLTFDSTYSNADMNAAWNFDANHEPLMHTLGQDVFLRQSGWMEQSFLARGSRIAWFILFSSRYGTYSNGTPANGVAYRDLHLMLRRWWHAHPMRFKPANLVPASSTGASYAEIIPKLGDGPFVVMSAWWGSTQEIEGIAFSSPGVLSKTMQATMLARQIRLAETIPLPSPLQQVHLSHRLLLVARNPKSL